jgi:uncharacterized membrane protein YgdD (TMEM256/DUF423 family)
MNKALMILGAANAFLAVGLGAFGAHGLKPKLSTEMLAVFQTAVQYHFYHALGLLLIGIVATLWPGSGLLKVAGWAMLGGIILFSGSLYILSISGIRWLGAVTPFGGLAFLAAWAMLVIALMRLP